MYQLYFCIKKYYLFFCYFLAVLSVPSVAIAQDNQNEPDNHERWYQVEMIVFARNDNAAQQEVWPHNIKLAYPENLITLKTSEAGDSGAFTMLKPSERQLNAQAASIARNSGYSLVFHQAWRQMIYNKKTSILINGGKTFNGHQELEGSIDLSVAQYLKLQTNLWLTQFSAANNINDLGDSWPELPSIPGTEPSVDQPTDYLIKRIVKISQQRSMRSQEVHYIDHPLLGIIIKIIPYDAVNQ